MSYLELLMKNPLAKCLLMLMNTIFVRGGKALNTWITIKNSVVLHSFITLIETEKELR